MKTEMEARDLRIWRMDHHLSLEDLAKHLGKHRNTVWNWENGAARLPVTLQSDLKRIETVLGAAKGSEAAVRRVRGHIMQRCAQTGAWTNDPARWTLETAAQARLDRDCAKDGDVELASRLTRTTWQDQQKD